MSISRPRILLLTGFAPLELSRLGEMGTDTKPFLALASIAKQDTFQLTIPTIGATALATYLTERGAEVEVKDYFFDGIEDSSGDIIGISSTFMGQSHVKEIASFARKKNPSSVIILGGPLSWSIEPSSLLHDVPEIDIIAVGEGEDTFYDLFQAVSSGADASEVPGVISRKNARRTPPRPRAPLDPAFIPTPEWKLMGLPSPRRLPLLPVETSRGCPYSCAYCSETHYWGKPPRYRGPDSVAAEIARNVREYGITTFRFADSCFSAPPDRCAAVCDAIYGECVQPGMPVKWSSYARISNLTPQLLKKMKRSGCVALDIGVESGDPEMLRRMGRRYSPEQAVLAAQEARELDIITNFNIVVGFPGETAESIDRTIEMLGRAQPDTFACFLLFIAPNMAVSSYPGRYRISGTGLTWRHTTMDTDEAMEGMARISRSVTGSCSFPGGEYFAGYLSALGYSSQQVRSFFRATLALGSGHEDPDSRSLVEEVCTRLKSLW